MCVCHRERCSCAVRAGTAGRVVPCHPWLAAGWRPGRQLICLGEPCALQPTSCWRSCRPPCVCVCDSARGMPGSGPSCSCSCSQQSSSLSVCLLFMCPLPPRPPVLKEGPAIIYNVPSRTGQDIPDDIVRHIAGHPNFLGMKECTGNERIGSHTKQVCGMVCGVVCLVGAGGLFGQCSTQAKSRQWVQQPGGRVEPCWWAEAGTRGELQVSHL